MSIRSSVLLIAALAALLPFAAKAQNTLPPDINPKTLSRLPPVTADDLDEEARRLLAARTNFTPGQDLRTSQSTVRESAASEFHQARRVPSALDIFNSRF